MALKHCRVSKPVLTLTRRIPSGILLGWTSRVIRDGIISSKDMGIILDYCKKTQATWPSRCGHDHHGEVGWIAEEIGSQITERCRPLKRRGGQQQQK